MRVVLLFVVGIVVGLAVFCLVRLRVLRADSGVADYVVGWLVLLPYAGLGCLLLVCDVVASVVGNLGCWCGFWCVWFCGFSLLVIAVGWASRLRGRLLLSCGQRLCG